MANLRIAEFKGGEHLERKKEAMEKKKKKATGRKSQKPALAKPLMQVALLNAPL